ATSGGGGRTGRDGWRLGVRQVDGAGQFLPAHRRAGQFRVSDGGHYASFHLRGDHRRELWRLVSKRCARLRIEHGMGRWLWIAVVVFRPIGGPADLARPWARLVVPTRWRAVRLASRPYRLWLDCWLNLRSSRQALARLFQRVRPDQP